MSVLSENDLFFPEYCRCVPIAYKTYGKTLKMLFHERNLQLRGSHYQITFYTISLIYDRSFSRWLGLM